MTIAHAVNSSDLTHVEHRQCDADVLHALARSSKKSSKHAANDLGLALLHVRDGLDAGRYNECLDLYYRACVQLLRNKTTAVRTVNRGLVQKACEMTLREYLLDVCEVCLGTDMLDYGERRRGERRSGDTTGSIGHSVVGERRRGDRRLICPKCNGTKRSVINHVSRRHALGISRDTYMAIWERLLPEFGNLLLVAERRCRGRVRKLLEG